MRQTEEAGHYEQEPEPAKATWIQALRDQIQSSQLIR